ncbi:MAG: lysozyme inhibitor LprI family protein [Pseudomonadota bacterium]
MRAVPFTCVLVMLTVSATAQPTPAKPSFDCAKASTAGETAICDDPVLARLDTELSRFYRRAQERDDAQDKTALLESQRQWLSTRDGCGAKTDCLIETYLSRLDDLSQGQESVADWFGDYEGPFGENGITITQEENDQLRVQLLGGTGSYTCDFGPGVGTKDGQVLTVAGSDDTDQLTLRRAGSAFYVPDTAANEAVFQNSCGARAPALTDSMFMPR